MESHVGRQGEDLVSSLNKLQLETGGLVYWPVLRCRWSPVIMGPHKLSPTSGVGQCLARHVSQGAEESITRMGWCVLGSIVRAMRDWTSVTTHQLSVGKKPRSRGAHACGVDNAIRRDTSKEPLEEIRPARVNVPVVSCMHGTWTARAFSGWMALEIRCTSWYPGGHPLRGCTTAKEPYALDCPKSGWYRR